MSFEDVDSKVYASSCVLKRSPSEELHAVSTAVSTESVMASVFRDIYHPKDAEVFFLCVTLPRLRVQTVFRVMYFACMQEPADHPPKGHRESGEMRTPKNKAHPYSRSEQDVQAVRIAAGKSTATSANKREFKVPLAISGVRTAGRSVSLSVDYRSRLLPDFVPVLDY